MHICPRISSPSTQAYPPDLSHHDKEEKPSVLTQHFQYEEDEEQHLLRKCMFIFEGSKKDRQECFRSIVMEQLVKEHDDTLFSAMGYDEAFAQNIVLLSSANLGQG
ncbi:hypothetical protein CferDRAFT_0814 [Chlorobium ferrooxidans DSM 13031]|uniref:Uncharacterized protein n=1 Tax=Chlorobium ferrooxidans DSM 13031 TaxID=377431 RepID=Q0YR98_9CHLB|nr:hypothetical protein CferDRAFT_0814 [Chlorobium ferrooxidans DSM 13031]